MRVAHMKSGTLRAILLVAAAGVLPLATGCNSASTSTSVTTGPTSAKCGLTLSGPSNVSPSGGTATVTVSAQPECGWTASTQASWISDLSPASGQGSGKFDFRAAANPVNASREGEIIVNDTRVRIAQEAAPCHFALSPEGDTIPAIGSTGTISVTGPAGCAWTATPSAAWINIDSNPSGNGNGTVTYRISANNSSSGRNGTIAIGDRSFSVMQAAVTSPPGPPPSCTVTLSSTSQNIGAGGGAGSPVTVTAASGCSWMSASNVSWITVTSGASGSGTGTVRFSVDANTGAARTGTIAIAGQTFTVNQAAAGPTCTYTVNPTSLDVPRDRTDRSIAVTAPSGCAWTAVSNNDWIDIRSGGSGSGNGTVSIRVAAFSGNNSRTGTLTIAGRTVTVTQSH